jgi:hypothetical protein
MCDEHYSNGLFKFDFVKIMLDKEVNHMIIIGIYINDCLIIGNKESIECLIDELKKHEFNLYVERNVNEYLSCCIEESKDEGKLTVIQPHLLTRLIKNFGEEIKGKRKFLTPGILRFEVLQIQSRYIMVLDKIFSTRH